MHHAQKIISREATAAELLKMRGGRSELFANKLSLHIAQSKLSQKIRELCSILCLILRLILIDFFVGLDMLPVCIDVSSFPAATAT